MVYILAICGALTNALTTILQRIGVEDAPADFSLHMSLIRYAARRKVWLLGCVGLVAGFLLQAFALHVGRLTIVQPILTLELPFLVAILAFWFRKPLRWQEWTGALVATAGLGVFLALAVPTGGNLVPGLREWGVAALVIILATALTVALARVGRPAWRATMFGASAAIMFAFTAALIKQMTADFNATPITFLTEWHVYAMAVTGLLAVFLTQNAFHAGPVTASQAALVIVDPLASIAIGVALFGDTIHTTGSRGALEIVALLCLFVGAAVLSRSPLVEHIRTEEPASSPNVRQPPHRPHAENMVDGCLPDARRWRLHILKGGRPASNS
ncbi:MAG TPA: DMT family transporter [Acidimicrobiales bacterium]|nr:DMT family transporter [Acidimicrobiales bacterium]